MGRGVRSWFALATIAGSVVLTDCAGPTAIEIDVYSEVPCATNAEVVLTVADDVSTLAGRAPSSTATRCDPVGDGTFRRGNVVLVPQDSKDKKIAFQLTTRNDAQSVASTCGTSGTGCIAARRQLRFLAHEVQTVRVDLRLSCLDVVCPGAQTCVKGQCVGADLVGACTAGCDEGTLTPDAGVVDAGPDVVDAGKDVVVEAGPSPIEIGGGGNYACALSSANVLRCWGDNANGRLGDGTVVDRPAPVDVLGGLGPVTQVVGGSGTTCALLTNGSVRCWGNNANGAVGDGTFTQRTSPTPVNLPDGVLALGIGPSSNHFCAVMADRTARCWGTNGSGELGDLSTTNRNAPVVVSGLANVAGFAVGGDFTCALLMTGEVRCWGGNGTGQLGDGSGTTQPSPKQVVGLTSGVKAIATGSDSACAILSTGEVRCWGDNGHGQIGDGTKTQRNTPVPVPLAGTDGVELAISSQHVCLRRLNGALKCWGENGSGELGDGTRTQRSSPVDATALTFPALRVISGSTHTCARVRESTTVSSVRCWGSNTTGELGIGSLSPVDSLTPLLVTNL